MVQNDHEARLAALSARIAAAKAVHQPPPKQNPGGHARAQLAWRMVTELVAGLIIGFGIGYGLDTLFGTIPIFLVLFVFAGLAAGVKTMLRSAQEMQALAARQAQDEAGAAGAAIGKEEDARG